MAKINTQATNVAGLFPNSTIGQTKVASQSSFPGLDYESMLSLEGLVKKHQVLETATDPLVLSCARYRLSKNYNSQYKKHFSLLQKDLFEAVENCDYTLAETIRDYYSKKFTIWALKGQELTKFRMDLKSIITNPNPKTFHETFIPIIYRLPEFYSYDTEFESMTRNLNKEIQNVSVPSTISYRLNPLGSMVNMVRTHKHTIEYWLKDEYNNLCGFTFAKNNPLLHLWEILFEQPYFYISGTKYIKTRNEVKYLTFDKWKAEWGTDTEGAEI